MTQNSSGISRNFHNVPLQGKGTEVKRTEQEGSPSLAWRCRYCGCMNLTIRCHHCGALDEPSVGPGLGPWLFDAAAAEIDGIERWGRDSAVFRDVTDGDTTFLVAALPLDVTRWVLEPLTRRVAQTLGGTVQMRHLFARLSTTTRDASLRIHTDYGMGATYACVLYCGDAPEEGPETEEYGTGFFRHHTHGAYAPDTLSAAAHDRLLREEAGCASAWTPLWVCPMQRNRLLVYPASAFHARVPAAGWGTTQQDGRLVIAGFFDVLTGRKG